MKQKHRSVRRRKQSKKTDVEPDDWHVYFEDLEDAYYYVIEWFDHPAPTKITEDESVSYCYDWGMDPDASLQENDPDSVYLNGIGDKRLWKFVVAAVSWWKKCNGV